MPDDNHASKPDIEGEIEEFKNINPKRKAKGEARIFKSLEKNGLITPLRHYVKIYVPSRDKNGRNLNNGLNRKILDSTHLFFAELNGGATEFLARGSYKTEERKIVKEDISVIQSFFEELDRGKLNKIIAFCYLLKSATGQESLGVEVDGSLYLLR
jgi:hypothetical protein